MSDFTQTQLDVLNQMVASGVLRTKFNGQEVEYRTLDDLIRARDSVKRDLALAQGGASAPMTHVNPVFSRGC